ncbi:enoyl-CoA hydratase/isomerase family protein [Pseudonocardia xishanensis]|uniref:2-(1,2-epoxy-1,2-dihydrophenyl)acetyl-CoA isomerase PaaG n=1 Tax=Pseudonocardia xishanensis TaxID=630995 RepID=A0ABP8RWF3_9PSEU
MSPSTITVDRQGPVVRLALDRPDRLNALDPTMLDELLDVLAGLAADQDVQGLVLTSAGRVFSAGVDLDSPFFMENVPNEGDFTGKRLLDHQHRVIQALYELPFPTVAGVNGDAVGGGGFGLAMACDVRVAVRGARFWMVPGELAVVQDFGLSWLVQKQIGPSRTLHMALLGAPVVAETGLGWGLVNEVVEPAELSGRLDEITAQLAAAGPDAARMLKLVVRNGAQSTLRDQLGLEAVANGLAFRSAEFADRKATYLDRLRGR